MPASGTEITQIILRGKCVFCVRVVFFFFLQGVRLNPPTLLSPNKDSSPFALSEQIEMHVHPLLHVNATGAKLFPLQLLHLHHKNTLRGNTQHNGEHFIRTLRHLLPQLVLVTTYHRNYHYCIEPLPPVLAGERKASGSHHLSSGS